MLMLSMSKLLATLLEAEEPLFSLSLAELENTTGQPSIDVRLLAEMSSTIHQRLRSLGLDPHDTTPLELYHALTGLAARHDEFLAKQFGASSQTEVSKLIPKIITGVETMPVPKTVWVLKHSVAKRLLKAVPPKKVMKSLGYRSIDSMLKREPVGAVFAGIRFLESSDWQLHFVKQYRKLLPTDFETRAVEIINLDSPRWAKAAKQHVVASRQTLTHLKELGCIVVLPMPAKKLPGITLVLTLQLLHYISEIRMYSAYFKLQQVHPNFGELVIQAIVDDLHAHVTLAGRGVHWRVVQRYFGEAGPDEHPELFEPHVQPEDLQWRKAEELLYKLEPALQFWHQTDYVAMNSNDETVSFNLLDNALSHLNKLPFERRAGYHFREALWNELYLRYMAQPILRSRAVRQLYDHHDRLETILAHRHEEILL